MAKKYIGKIIVPPGVIIERHEKIAVDYLAAKHGKDVTFLLPNRKKGSKTPDVEMDGKLWEIKSPTGKGSRTIENILRSALRQSRYIILDLRRMDGRVPTSRHIKNIKKQFDLSKSFKHIVVITRQEERIDFTR